MANPPSCRIIIPKEKTQILSAEDTNILHKIENYR